MTLSFNQVRRGKYSNVKVLFRTDADTVIEHQDAVYLICDGGYHK